MIRNLAILAHVDAGKTTLAERILFMAGEVSFPGNVDEGLATLDYLPEEKAKGITIEAGITSFHWKNQKYNLVDTPGHIDFGAEVDLALEAVDGAILVISGTSGVETQTIAAWKKLKAKNLHPILFINKLDHPDSRLDEVLMEVEERLGCRPVLLNTPDPSGIQYGMLDVITSSRVCKDASGKETLVEKLASHSAALDALRTEACEAVSVVHDGIMGKLLEGKSIEPRELLEGLQALALQETYVLCYCGSALQCSGVRQLMTGIGNLIEPSPELSHGFLGTIFRIRHHREYGEIALFQCHASLPKKDWPKGLQFSHIQGEMLLPLNGVTEGDLCALQSADFGFRLGMQIGMKGEDLGDAPTIVKLTKDAYAPLLHSRIECLRAEDWQKIDRGLTLLAHADPSMQVRRNEEVGGWVIKTVGEVQLDVTLSRLQREFDCEIRAGKPEVMFQEEFLQDVPEIRNTFQAPTGVAISVAFGIQKTSFHAEPSLTSTKEIPPDTRELLEDALREFAEQGVRGKGPLRGFSIHIANWDAPVSTPLPWIRKVFTDALSLHVKPDLIEVFEPYMEMELTAPQDFAGNLIGDLQARGGKVKEIDGDGKIVKIILEVPLQKVFGYSTIGRSISKGTASYALRFTGYRSVQA